MIVSHDLDMAIEFADVIVPIVKSASKDTTSGIIDHCYNFRKKDDFWVDHENNRLFDIKSLLIQMYQEEVLWSHKRSPIMISWNLRNTLHLKGEIV